MATATKSKPATQPAQPVTFEEINRRKMRERVEAYREIVTRYATGETMTVADMEQAAELLDQLGLPQYAFDRDADAVRRFNATRAKYDTAVEAADPSRQRAEALTVEIDVLRKKLEALREEQRIMGSRAGKPAAYGQTLSQLKHDHPHVLADLDTATKLRIEELDRRKRSTVEVGA